MRMNKTVFDMSNQDYMSSCIKHIDDELAKCKINKKTLLKTELLCEEAILKLATYAQQDEKLNIRIIHSLSKPAIEISCCGDRIEEFSGEGNISYAAQNFENDAEEIDTGLLILKANDGIVKYSNNEGLNLFRIKAGKGEQSSMYLTLISLVAAIIVGLLFRQFVPGTVTQGLCNYLFSPIKTMFISALKIVVGPVVFFSIATCISQFTDLSELGKIGAKIIGLYTFTTLVAVCMGLLIFNLINPGQFGGALQSASANVEVAVNTDADTSIISTIVNIVPSNLLKPFVEGDTLQIIFLAILLGATVGMIGSYSIVIKEIFDACNELFLTLTTLIAKLIPLAVFSSMFIMITNTGLESMIAMFGMAGTDILALSCMIVIYGILILFVGRINPMKFYKKNAPGMINAFTLASSNAAMPMNMQICTDSLGISPKVCNFSIPLGTTINMDGVSVHLAVASMFLAKMYGVEVPGSMMLSIVITIIMLSLGAPGVPGSSLVCLGVLLGQIGVPIEAIGLIMGVDSLLDMFRTVSNTTGDMAATLIVARLEKLLDLDKYNS